MPLDLEPLELEPVGSGLKLEPLDLEPVDPRALRKADLQAQQAAAREEGEDISWGTGYRAEQAAAFGNVGRGVAQVPAGTLKFAGTVADSVRRWAPDASQVGQLGVGGDQSALTTAGEWIEQQANRLPSNDPEALDAQFQTGIGQLGGMMAGGGLVGKLAGKAVTRGALAAGASEKAAERLAGRAASAYGQGGAVAAGFGQEFSDAFERAQRLGDDPDTALAKSLGYASVATMIESAAGAGRVFRQYFPSPQQAQQALTKLGVSRAVAGNFLAGYGEEASQRIAQNVIVEPGSDPLAGANEEGRVGALVQGLVGLPAAGRGYRPATTRTPDGHEVIVNQETGTTEFAAAAQTPDPIPQTPPAAAIFRGPNGEDIRVDLGGATLEQAQAAIFRQNPGAEFVGVELSKAELLPEQLSEEAPSVNKLTPATPPTTAAPAATAEAATPGISIEPLEGQPYDLSPPPSAPADLGAGAASPRPPAGPETIAPAAAPSATSPPDSLPLAKLKDNVTGAVERGEKQPIAGIPAQPTRGDWVSYKDSYGKPHTGMVSSVMKVGRIIPGVGAETPRTEYMVQDGNGNYLPSPGQGEAVIKIARPLDSAPADKEIKTDERGTEQPGRVQGTGGQPGQPVADAPPMDVRPPAGPVPPTAPAAEAGPVVRPELPASPDAGGQTPGRGRGKASGVGSGAGGDPSPAAPGPTSDQPALPPGAAADAPQPARVEDQNHILPATEDWIPAGAKAKANANLAAVRLLRKLEAAQRNPTPEEKAVLAKYVGWGGLKQLFDTGKEAYRTRPPWNEDQRKEYENWEKQWGKLYDEVKSELTAEEWDTARASILNAHYTSRTVINGVWQVVERLGFKGGSVLETSAGIGHFIGLQPDSLRSASRWQAVELDQVSGRLLQKLYPQSRVQVTGFQDARIPVNSVDLIVGNVPFAKDGPTDKRYPSLSLHNYFFARGLDLLKPGGLMVAITSDSTMDGAASQKARALFAERADLVGAIRLPNNAFKENAGTEVTTDILIFRKRDGSPFAGQPFLNTTEAATYKGEPVEINEYFAAHPEMMLGRMSKEGTMYAGEMNALLPTPGADLSQQLAEAAAKLPTDAFGAQSTPEQVMAPASAANYRPGSLVFQDGKPYLSNADGSLEVPDWASSANAVKQAQSYVSVRDVARSLILKQLDADGTPEQIESLRKELNRTYDAYVKKHGALNKRGSAFLDEDVDFPLALALEDDKTSLVEGVVEKGRDKGKKVVRRLVDWHKSKIFFERTIFPRQAPTSAASIEDGYQVSMNFRGRVDVGYIAELTGQPVDAVKAGLVSRGLAFENPASGQLEPRWQYLSGNVKRKLREAQSAAENNPAYEINIAELEKVQPPAIPMELVSVRLGSPWVPEKIIERFLEEKLGVTAKVNYTPQTGNWSVSPQTGTSEAVNTTTYGIHGFGGHDLVGISLNLKSATVTRPVTRISETTGKSYEAEEKDPGKTLEAQEKQDRVKKLFVEWVKQTPAAARELETIYNEQYNGVVSPSFEAPSWEHYPNASSDIALRHHQKRVVTRMLQNSTLLAHAVGTGKTYAMITAAMEQRRLGLARKPMIVVQNATLEQFARSFKRLYPTARILAPNARQRDAKNRNKTMSRIATGEWDAVIVPQSFINMLPDDPAREKGFIQNEIAEMEAAKIEANAREGKKSPKAADLQRAIDRLKEKLTNLAARKVDDVLTFEQLGVDSLFVDEAHAYKKLQFSTKMESIKGLDVSASQRGFSMMMKARWVQEKNQGRNVTFATGTPVSNTIAEAWTMMRYLRPDVLKDYAMERFDSFAGTFGETVTQLEMTAGGTWKPVTRFAKYTNGPELIAAWRTVADVVTPEEINLPGLPALKNGKVEAVVVKQSAEVKRYVLQLRAELAAFEAMSGKEKRDNSHIPLVVFGRAKKASLDMRMIDPSLPDEPGSKLNIAADNVAKIWRDSESVKGTQMVFADSYQDNPDAPRFNLYQELKRKLVERGIPEEQIVIITADIKDAKREVLFDKFNNGEIRVVIGSTERMGVGVNAQRKLIGLHHLDAPPRPMDLEQRNGRIMRQGNENPEVQILQYGVENTLDAAMFQKLATKQKFINQILRGDLQGRNFEDAANETSLTFEEQMAAFSGDPLALERVSLDNQVRQLSGLQAGHFEQVRKGREELETLTNRRIPTLKQEYVAAAGAAQRFTKAFSSGEYAATVGKTQVEGRKDVVAALDAEFEPMLKRMAEQAESAIAGGKHWGGMESLARKLVLNGQELRYKATIYIQHVALMGENGKPVVDDRGQPVSTGRAEAPVIEWQFEGRGASHRVTGGQGLLQGVPSELLNITKSIPENIAASLAKAERDQRELAGFVQQPFDRTVELEQAKARLAEVDGILASRGKEAVGATDVLIDVVKSPKPLEAQRNQILRILDEMERIERDSKEWAAPTINYSREKHGALLKKLNEIEKQLLVRANDAAAALLDVTATEETKAAAEEKADAADASVRGFLGGTSANPFLNPKFWNAVAVSGARMLRDLGQFTATQAQWSAAMLKQFGQRIQQALAATWNRLMRLQTQQTNGVSAIGQGHLNQIEVASVNANIAEEQKPVYSEEDLAKGAPGLGIRVQPMSKQIAYLGGAALLASKQKLDVTGALQAAAVKKQSDALWQQLVESSASGNPLTKWKLPAWLIGSPRARAFKQRVLHIAARLNATGRDAAGNFTFADFTMRAGTMSLATAKQSQLSVGDQFTVNDPLTGVTETLTLGPIITTPEGRVFHQLARPVAGATQAELYQHFAREYPELIWFLDMFIDPALAGLRQTINGIEVPVFNRFAAAAMMADGNPNFSPLTAYTPDVLVTRSLMGAIRGAWHKAGVRSPGRKYKSGTSREGGHVRDLLSGFNVRTWQMLQEKSRREWMQVVLKSATPIRQNQVPAGWVKLETGMEELWQAVKRLRNWKSPVDPATGAPLFPETEQRATDDGSAEYNAFFLEAMKLRGKHLMLPQTLVDQLVRKYVAHVEHGTLYRLGSWLVRNSTQLFLVAPVTVMNNVLTNDMFTLQAATRRILSGVAGGQMQDLRFARELFTAEFFKWFPGLRTLVDPQWRATQNAGVLPENLFADQTMLADLKVRLDEDPMTYLRQGEIGAAALNFIRYGNIDTRAKTRMAYAWLRAQAVTNARKAGLRGAARRASVDAYLANPPVADMAAAVEVAGFELLNYADSPAWLEDMASGKFSAFGGTVDVGDFGRLVMPFPRFGYHFIAKTAREASAVKLLLGKVPKGQRADAFADLITFLMWPAGGLGILAAYGLKGLGDDDDEARKRVGTASIKTVDADGNVLSKPLPRELITSNRINLSAWARGLGLGTDREEDFWLRVRSYPVIAMAGAALLAEEDARKFGADEGAKTYASAVKDLASDFFSVGMALKAPAKILGDLGNQRRERTVLDPYAAGVPTVAYLVDQTLDSFVPGTRQFDLAVKWMDPVQRRRASSKTLDFEPTVWDAARVGHVTGLMDRLFAGADSTTGSTLPPEGAIDRRTRSVPLPQEYTLQQRIAELAGFNLRPIDRRRYEDALAPYATRN